VRFLHLQEDESNNKPGSQKDSDCAVELPGVVGEGSGETETRVNEGSVGKPEVTVGDEG